MPSTLEPPRSVPAQDETDALFEEARRRQRRRRHGITSALLAAALATGLFVEVGGSDSMSPDAGTQPKHPRPYRAPGSFPAGISAIGVRATATAPWATRVSISQTITKPAAVHRMIAVVEGLKRPARGTYYTYGCPIDLPGFELEFLEAGQPRPVVTLTTKPEGCDIVEVWVHGQLERRLADARTVVKLIEELLATKL